MDVKLADSLMAQCRLDPEFFCHHLLGVKPWRKQAQVLRALRDHGRVAVRSGHGTGKSFVAAAAALWFLYSFYPAKVITTAPTQNQVRAILWTEIRRLHAQAKHPLGGKLLEEALKLGYDAFAVGFSTDEPERFQGFHAEHLLVILDEAPGVRPEVWEAAATLLTTSGSRMLAIGNPTRTSGNFYRCFAPESQWKKLHISCLESPNLEGNSESYPALVTRAWIEEKRAEWGEVSPFFQARVLGEFPDEGEGSLLPRSFIEAAANRLPPAVESATYHLGVDVARHGEDSSVFLLRDRHAVRFLEVQHGWSTMQVAGRVVRLIKKYALDPGRVFIDDTGLGAGVTDRLRELGYPVRAVVLGAAADDKEHFANLRAQCFWGLRELLCGEDHPPFALPAVPCGRELLRELGEIQYLITSTGAIRIEKKTGLRSRVGRSPDRADALALTLAPAAKPFAPELTVL